MSCGARKTQKTMQSRYETVPRIMLRHAGTLLSYWVIFGMNRSFENKILCCVSSVGHYCKLPGVILRFYEEM